MYKRITKDRWDIEGYCSKEYGWEVECSEDTRVEGKRCLQDYRNNVNYPVRLVKRREKIVNI